MAFIRVSTSIPKLTSLLLVAGVVAVIVLVLADKNKGEMTWLLYYSLDLISKL
jgi:hypothetical protein